MRRDPNYYRVRTVVRLAFWSAVTLGGVLIAHAVSEAVTLDPCPVTITPGAWQARPGEVVNLSECEHPAGIRLLPGGTWITAP